MARVLACFALLLLNASSSYAQWERVVVSTTNEGGYASNVVHGSPHPLQYFLTPSPERDPSNSLCLGCPVATANGRKKTLQDYEVESSQRVLGKAFGRKVIELVLSFRLGPELMKTYAEEAARENGHPGTVYSESGAIKFSWRLCGAPGD